MNKIKRSYRLVKSTAIKDPDLFLRHNEKYKLSLAINSQTQLTVALKDILGRGASRVLFGKNVCENERIGSRWGRGCPLYLPMTLTQKKWGPGKRWKVVREPVS